ncbi:hypothetical protein [Nocardia sp. NBC_00416]|uniref:hypothetical protein n=1 Tax=Nocardia sp. NBC_00416 TaxID=2975991 RepID=UPI002E1C96C0
MIGKFEANKDLIQELTSSGARRVGNIAGIITGTIAEVTREIGEWVTDAIEMNEAAAAARRDAAATEGPDEPAGVGDAADAPETAAGTPRVHEGEVVVDADIVDIETADSDPSGKRR